MRSITEELIKLKSEGLYRVLRTVEGAQGPRVALDGREVLLLCSNDYLGLANHPKVKSAATAAIKRYGFGSGASRLVSGSMSPHRELEEKIAGFKGTEAAILFNSGYAANTGTIPALVSRGDIVFSDRLNHASIVDGCIVSRAEVKRYRHADMKQLAALLEPSDKKESEGRKRLIVTDGIFSMDGDIAPLGDIARLAKLHGAMLMVDDAHGTGVLGEGGRGTAESLDIPAEDIDIHMGTLGKALGSFGAYVAGSGELIEYLLNRARPFIYSTALPPAAAAAATAALDIVMNEPERREKLKKNAAFMREGLESLGFDTMGSGTQIIPVLTGETERATEMMGALLEEGLFAQAIRPPTVPEGKARIRVTVTAGHSGEDMERALEAFGRAGRKAGLI